MGWLATMLGLLTETNFKRKATMSSSMVFWIKAGGALEGSIRCLTLSLLLPHVWILLLAEIKASSDRPMGREAVRDTTATFNTDFIRFYHH